MPLLGHSMAWKPGTPVEIAAKGCANSEDVLKSMGAIGAAVDDDTPSSSRACMPVTGRGLRPNATHAVPPKRGCVEQVQVVVECTLRSYTCPQLTKWRYCTGR